MRARTAAAFAGLALLATGASAQEPTSVRIAYFLEWATPNLIAKANGDYERALGLPVEWVAFDTGTQMTEAMLAGDIDIAYSQGMAPFVAAVNDDAPLSLVAVAVQYPANDCVVRDGEKITVANAAALEGRSVAVPVASMADYSFRLQMRALGVDTDRIDVLDRIPVDGALALANGSVAMACGFGGNAMARMYEVGTPLLDAEAMRAADIVSMDVVSVRDAFLDRQPALVNRFLGVTHAANALWSGSADDIATVAFESGMDPESVRAQLRDFTFPVDAAEQRRVYFGDDGIARTAIDTIGTTFATEASPARDSYANVIDLSPLR